MTQPNVSVGVVSARQITFTLNTIYEADAQLVSGIQQAHFHDGHILWQGRSYDQLLFSPQTAEASFSIEDVVIGIRFHWERKERQTFSGALRLLVEGEALCAVNVLPVEDYLQSVISSEMNAEAPLQFLKAHAVISRSWLLAQMERRLHGRAAVSSDSSVANPVAVSAEPMRIKWYDQEDHIRFDVCADDHCQRYQGITRMTSPAAREAVLQTSGQVLSYDGAICDARFSKCCGGILEEFATCWDDVQKPYLVAKRDVAPTSDDSSVADDVPASLPDMDEATAERWIKAAPDAFCRTTDRYILSRVLNSYDQETADFYRWHVHYTTDELSELVSRKLQVHFGQIRSLIPLRRGPSARISLLKIVGTEATLVLGKELEIRRALSPSHLLSSAFYVEPTPDGFTLHGAGWGHGVGLCQIGAAVMGQQGYDYLQILRHYYSGADIQHFY